MSGWTYDQVVWGSTECARKACSAPAACLLDGEPLCLDDADAAVERAQAVELAPALRELLPDWRE